MGRRDKDLNRDFPDPMLRGHANLLAGGREQPETLAAMAWASSTTFTASAQLHEVGCAPASLATLAALSLGWIHQKCEDAAHPPPLL